MLTRKRWREALEFAKAVDAKIYTGFSVGRGVRDQSSLREHDEVRLVGRDHGTQRRLGVRDEARAEHGVDERLAERLAKSVAHRACLPRRRRRRPS